MTTPKPTPRTLAHRATHYHKLTVDIPIPTYTRLAERAECAGVPVGRMLNSMLELGLDTQAAARVYAARPLPPPGTRRDDGRI